MSHKYQTRHEFIYLFIQTIALKKDNAILLSLSSDFIHIFFHRLEWREKNRLIFLLVVTTLFYDLYLFLFGNAFFSDR